MAFFFKRGLRQNNLVYCILSEIELAVIFKNEYSLEVNKQSSADGQDQHKQGETGWKQEVRLYGKFL